MPEVAAEYGAIYNEWDEARMDALHPPKAQEKESPRRHLQWLRGQLGACGEPQFMYPTPRPFKHNLDLFAATRLGKCQLVRPWVVGPYGALFHAQCEHGDAAVLRLGVHEDGTISKAELLRSSDVYFGPPVSLPASRM